MTIAAILRNKANHVVSIKADATIEELARLLVEHRIGAVLVRNAKGAICGLISERDVIHGIAGNGRGTTQMKVSELMTTELVTCTPIDSVDHVMSLMTQSRIRHVPVMEAGKLVGIISIGDVVKFRIEQTEREAQALREYITA